MNHVPIVIEKGANGSERAYDIYSRMLKDRIVFLTGEVHDGVSNSICAQMLFLESEDPEAPISFYINSPGGSVTAGMAMYDTMQYIKCPVHTMVMGTACSMGSLLATAGEPGERRILPHAEYMIHQPSAGTSGKVTDMEILVEEVKRMKTMLTQIYVNHNTAGKTFDDFYKAMERDNFMTPEEVVEWGILDEVVATRENVTAG